MLQGQIEPQKSFDVISEWDIPQVNVGDTITITNTYVIRGTQFIVLEEKDEAIPRYEFKYALRNGLIA